MFKNYLEKSAPIEKQTLWGSNVRRVLRFINFDNSSIIPNFSHHLGSNKEDY